MSNGITYGVAFPFVESTVGDYVKLTETANDEIRADLINLLLTRKGSRYFLPDFGTRLYEYIFEPLDTPTFDSIEAEIRESCEKYLPNLKITNISVKALTMDEETSYLSGDTSNNNYSLPGKNTYEYTAKVRIDYIITDSVFGTKDFVILNI
jgi:phage baseplate assembly protein W